jgi:hypothetical protein
MSSTVKTKLRLLERKLSQLQQNRLDPKHQLAFQKVIDYIIMESRNEKELNNSEGHECGNLLIDAIVEYEKQYPDGIFKVAVEA